MHEAGMVVGDPHDEGIDGVIKQDKLSLDVVYVQAKRWSGPVGRQVVQAFAGALEGHRAQKGVLITTSGFTQDARQYPLAVGKKIVWIDGQELARLMVEHGVGVTVVRTYAVKKLDHEHFQEE